MSAILPTEDIVVFVDKPDAKFSVMRVDAGTPDKEIVGKVGNAAYLVVTFNQAKTLQQAANIAKADGLVYVPENIVAGMRRRIPDVTMREIRDEFQRRVSDYQRPVESESEREEIFPFSRGFPDIFDDLFGSPFDRRPR